jgi:26S proteasome regulatory subunit N8
VVHFSVNNECGFLTLLLFTQVSGKLTALKGLDARLKEIRSYLDLVIDGKLPLNHEILYHLQVCLS